jgi:hypothetical protein
MSKIENQEIITNADLSKYDDISLSQTELFKGRKFFQENNTMLESFLESLNSEIGPSTEGKLQNEEAE